MLIDRYLRELRIPSPAPLDRGEGLRCALLALVIWLLHFSIARHSQYVGDDFNVILALLDGGLWQFFHHAIRPLEYWAAWLSMGAGWPLWLLFSLVASVVTALATLVFLNTITHDASAQWWKAALCASSPIAALPGFQIDTVSQALANMFSLLLVLSTFSAVNSTDAAAARRRAWATALLGLLCIASKETTYGLALACSLLLLFRIRRQALIPVACLLLALATSVIWSKFNTFDISPGAHYGIKANPLYWLFTFVYSCIVAVSTLPSSLTLSGSAFTNQLTTALTGIGALALLALVALLAVAARNVLRARVRPQTTGGRHGLLLALLLLASLTPALFFKAGELYATHAAPYIKTFLAIALLSAPWKHAPRLLAPLAGVWLLASLANMSFYTISSGYTYSSTTNLAEVSPWTQAIRQAVDHQKRIYSVYSVNNIALNQARNGCVFDPWQADICLPADIMSGFPQRVAKP